MLRYLACLAFLSLIILVVLRLRQLQRLGIAAFQFGKLDKRDFLIPPFALLYLYQLLGSSFGWPVLGRELFAARWAAWLGMMLCLLGVLFFAWALVSFGQSFRVGLDEQAPGSLVTGGAFARSRNPIYLAFFLVFCGIFLIIPNWLLLLYLLAASLLFHRQVKLEEASLQRLYGAEYAAYCQKVRRYL